MCKGLPEELITAIMKDIMTADTFANKDILPDHLKKDIYNYVSVSESPVSDGETEKVLLARDGEPSASVKGYNLIVNLKLLWEQLPGNAEDIITILNSDEFMTNLVAIIHLLRRTAKMFTIEFSKKQETVFVIIGQLSRGSRSASFQQICQTYENLRRSTAIAPLADENEIQDIIKDLLKIRSIEKVSGDRYKSIEKTIKLPF